MTERPPDYVTQVSDPSIHNPPGGKTFKPPSRRDMALLRDYRRAVSLADTAVALAGVLPIGKTGQEALREWGEQRIIDAQNAYYAALGAQDSANFANSQIAAFLTDQMASGVEGGVALNETFSGAEAGNLGASFTRRSTDVGAGSFGPDGAGLAVWTKSGGNARRHIDRHNTPLATNYQIVRLVLASLCQSPTSGSDAENVLCARMNADADDFVYAAITHDSLEVGCRVDDSITVFDTIPVTPEVGDTWLLYVGTDDDDYEIIVKQNAIIRYQDIDDGPVSQMSGGHLYAGLSTKAGFGFGFFTQVAPGSLDSWAAADRLPEVI